MCQNIFNTAFYNHLSKKDFFKIKLDKSGWILYSLIENDFHIYLNIRSDI